MTQGELETLKHAVRILTKLANYPKSNCEEYNPMCISCHWNLCIGVLNETIDTYEENKKENKTTKVETNKNTKS